MAQPVLFPDGKFYNVEGVEPEVIKRLYEKLAKEQAQQAQGLPSLQKPKSSGFLGLSRAGELLSSGVSEFAGSTAEGLQTAGTILGADPDADTGLRRFAERRRDAREDVAPIKPLQEAENPIDVIQSTLSYLTQSLPEMGVVVGSAIAGAKVGAATIPLPHPVAKAVGGLGGATVGAIMPFLGRNTEEFREVKGRNPEQGEAAALMATAGVQSALNSVITALVPFTKVAEKTGIGAAISGKLTKGSQNALANAVIKGTQGTILEGSTEAAQDILQILAANDFDADVLKTPENVFRVTESALAGAAIGGTLGGVGGGLNPELRTKQDNSKLLEAAKQVAKNREELLLLEDKRGTPDEIRKITQKKIVKGQPLTETEVDQTDLDEVETLFSQGKVKQAEQKLISMAQQEAIADLSGEKITETFTERGKIKTAIQTPLEGQEGFRTRISTRPSRTAEVLTDPEQLAELDVGDAAVLQGKYRRKTLEKLKDLVNSKQRKFVVVSRDDKGKVSGLNLTNNELIASAKTSTDPQLRGMAEADVPTEIKASRIARYLNKTATKRQNELGKFQTDPVTGKRYKPKFVELTTQELEAMPGYVTDVDQDVAFEQNPSYYVYDRAIYNYGNVAAEPTIGAREKELSDPTPSVINVAPDPTRVEPKREQTEKLTETGLTGDQLIEGGRQRIDFAVVPETEAGDITGIAKDTVEGKTKFRFLKKPKPITNEDGSVNQEETQRAIDTNQGALDYLEERIQKLEKRGRQGKIVADSLRFQVIKPVTDRVTGQSPLTADQVAGAILGAEAIVDTLGEKGDTDLRFLMGLTGDKATVDKQIENLKAEAKAKGQNFEGLRKGFQTYGYDANGKIKSIIELTFNYGKDVKAEEYAQTAAHEAFHVLQDVFSVSDPSARSLLNGAFTNPKKLPSRIKRLLRNYNPELLKRINNDQYKPTPTETQALVYETYKKALQEGDPDPLGGVLGKYFNFLTRFFGRFRNALQGAGYRTVEDIIEQVDRGKFTSNFENAPVEARKEALEKENQQVMDDSSDWNVVNQETGRNAIEFVDPPKRILTNPDGTINYKYKLMSKDEAGDLFTIFIDQKDVYGNENTPNENRWIGANPDVYRFIPDIVPGSDKTKSGVKQTARPNVKEFEYVPTGPNRTTGESVPIPNETVKRELFKRGHIKTMKANNVKVVAYRPGIHAADFPEAGHIAYRDDNVWVQIEIPNDNTQEIMRKAQEMLNEKGEAQLKEIPYGGFYKYKNKTFTKPDGSTIANDWVIAGSFRIANVLTDQEVNQIRKDNGIPPLEQDQYYRKTVGRESIDLSRSEQLLEDISNQKKFPPNPKFDPIFEMFKVPDNFRLLTAVDLLYPPEGVENTYVIKKGDKKAVIKEVGFALQKRAKQILGKSVTNTTDDPVTQQEQENIARAMAAYAYIVKQESPDSAIDWYTRSIQEAIDAVATIYPEIKTDRNHRAAYSMAVSITSQGVNVERNANIGLAIYEHWRQNGKFPIYGEGKSQQAMEKNFELANKVDDVLSKKDVRGPDGRRLTFFDFLDLGKVETDPVTGEQVGIKLTVADLKKVLNEAGFTTTDAQAVKETGDADAKADISLTGENAGSEVYGSYILGPKIGNGFYQNLMGNFVPITMDMWFMRTWGRMTGTLVGKPEAFEGNLEKIVEEFQKIHDGELSIPLTNNKDTVDLLDYADRINKLRNKFKKDSPKATNQAVAKFLQSETIDKKTNKREKEKTFQMLRDIESINQRWYKSNAFIGDPNDKVENPDFDSKDRPQLFKSNTAAITNGVSTIDTPRNGTDRQWMRDTVNMARRILKANGLDLTSADFQALIWYPEKDLFKLLSEGTVEKKNNISYSEANRRMIQDGYQSIRTSGQGELFSVVQPSRGGKSGRKPKRPTDGQPSEGDSRLGRESIRLEEGDVSETIRNVISDADKQQGILPKNFQQIKFSVLKYLAPINLANKKVRDKFVDEFVSGLEPVARLERAVRKKLEERFPTLAEEFKKLPGKLLPYEQGAFKAIEFAQQMSARVAMMAKEGAPQLNEDGTVGVKQGTKGLFDIFEPIGQSGDYLRYSLYVYAKRAARLKQEGRENLMTDEQIQEGLNYENDTFRRVHEDHMRFNDALMQFLVDTGSITQAQKDTLVGTSDYIPFHRIIDEEAYENGLFGQVRKARQAVAGTSSAFDKPDQYIRNVMRPLEGGTEKIGDLYTNVFANAQAIIGAGLKNIAMQKTVKLIENAKELGFYDGVDNAPQTVEKDGDNVFAYRENGVKKYYDVGSDADIVTALQTFTPIQMQGFLKIMQNFSRVFRNLITITPGFMIANAYRGELAGFVTVDAPIRPVIDGLKGLRNVLTDAETAKEMKIIGGFGGYTFGENNENFAAKMKRMYRRHEGYDIIDTPTKMKDMMQNMMDKVNEFGEATELSTREGIYRTLINNGVSKADAAYESINLINYNRRGNPQGLTAQTLGMLIPLIPFLNARIQGLYRTGTALSGTESNARKSFMKGGIYLGLSLGVYGIMSQNEDWEKEPLYRKLNYHIIYAGDKKFLIPKPFEIGAIFSTMPELLLDGIAQKDGKLVRDGVLQILINNFQLNPIPQAVKPLLEIGVNRDFFKGRELESLGQRGLPTAQRAYSTTSQFAQLAGQATSVLGISPIEFEQLVNGYTGSMGALILGMFDAFLGVTGAVPQRPAGLFGDNPLSDTAELIGISRFYKEAGDTDPANKFLGEFYDMKREADQLLRGINHLREKGNLEAAQELRKDNRGLLVAKKSLNKMFTQINEINDRIQGVKQRDLDQTQKRDQIRVLVARRNMIAERITKIKERIRKAA
tara:strand:+ start:1730 stop:10168 length:8439 start_codon:yes stop_codon:yes gene_type:complete